MRNIFLILITLLAISCGETATTSETGTENDAEVATPAPAEQSVTPGPAPGQAGTLYPSISMETMQMLYNECNYIDYSFTTDKIPFSMSINEKSSIQQTLGLLSTTPAYVREDCESIGRMYLQKDGVNLMEIDLYFFGEGCQYWVFIEDGEPTYANYLTPDGVAYYQRFFNQTNVGN